MTPEGFDSAYQQAVAKFDAVHRLTEQIAPDKIGLALTPDDVRRIAASGRKVAVIGIENGYSIGMDIARVKEFYDRGGRYMSLAHNGHSQLADSNTGEANNEWLNGDGLSRLGKQVIAEMNKWGIMVDCLASVEGREPAGDSRCRRRRSSRRIRRRAALANVSRNLDDETLCGASRRTAASFRRWRSRATSACTPPERQPAHQRAESGIRHLRWRRRRGGGGARRRRCAGAAARGGGCGGAGAVRARGCGAARRAVGRAGAAAVAA